MVIIIINFVFNNEYYFLKIMKFVYYIIILSCIYNNYIISLCGHFTSNITEFQYNAPARGN